MGRRSARAISTARLVARFFLSQEVALQLDVNVFMAEDVCQALDGAARFFDPALGQRRSQRTVVASGQADEASGVFPQVVFAGGDDLRPPQQTKTGFAGDPGRRRVFGAAHLHARDQPAQVLIAGAGLGEQWKAARFTFHVSRFKRKRSGT